MDTDRLKKFLEQYERYVGEILAPTREQVKSVFRTWVENEYWVTSAPLSRLPTPSPIQSTRTRIKRPESVVDKILRRPNLFPDGLEFDSIKKMHDAVGGRIVVYFLSNLPLIDRALRNSEALELSEESPPIAYLNQDLLERLGLTNLKRGQKESGYASIHYIARLRESPTPQRPWFEIQVRTLAEHLWGEIEHVLGYKPNKRTSFAVRRQFQIIGSQLSSIDDHFNLLFEELSRFQEEVQYHDADPLNAENIPAILSEIGAGCAQREIDGLLKLLNSRGIETVGSLREIATAKHLDTIRNIYWQHEGRAPGNFEVVASLAAIKRVTDDSGIVEAIRTQIEFLNAWEELKRSL
ncbi:MAG TPA: hypothetical protein VN999_18265 [Thermoanaerobaculia bacterium]|nr:hypothetical protein [Thermoanaerobaculia bacterium]